MRKRLVSILACMFIAGCGAAQVSSSVPFVLDAEFRIVCYPYDSYASTSMACVQLDTTDELTRWIDKYIVEDTDNDNK